MIAIHNLSTFVINNKFFYASLNAVPLLLIYLVD